MLAVIEKGIENENDDDDDDDLIKTAVCGSEPSSSGICHMRNSSRHLIPGRT